jgi:hypothetical protein
LHGGGRFSAVAYLLSIDNANFAARSSLIRTLFSLSSPIQGNIHETPEMERHIHRNKHQTPMRSAGSKQQYHPHHYYPQPSLQQSQPVSLVEQQLMQESAIPLRQRSMSLGSAARRNPKFAPPQPTLNSEQLRNGPLSPPNYIGTLDEQDSELNRYSERWLSLNRESNERSVPLVGLNVPYMHNGAVVVNKATQTYVSANTSKKEQQQEQQLRSTAAEEKANALRRVASMDYAEKQKKDVR